MSYVYMFMPAKVCLSICLLASNYIYILNVKILGATFYYMTLLHQFHTFFLCRIECNVSEKLNWALLVCVPVGFNL